MADNDEQGTKKTNEVEQKLVGGMFLGAVTGISILFGFGMTLAMAKKKDPHFFTKGLSGTREIPESGGSLAMRALGWGTLYAVSGFTVFCWAVTKAMGVSNLGEFRDKMQSIMPVIPKKEPQGRSDFKTVRELVNYIIEEDKVKKSER